MTSSICWWVSSSSNGKFLSRWIRKSISCHPAYKEEEVNLMFFDFWVVSCCRGRYHYCDKTSELERQCFISGTKISWRRRTSKKKEASFKMSKVGDGHFKLKDAPSSSKLEKSPSNDNFGEFASNVFLHLTFMCRPLANVIQLFTSGMWNLNFPQNLKS